MALDVLQHGDFDSQRVAVSVGHLTHSLSRRSALRTADRKSAGLGGTSRSSRCQDVDGTATCNTRLQPPNSVFQIRWSVIAAGEWVLGNGAATSVCSFNGPCRDSISAS